MKSHKVEFDEDKMYADLTTTSRSRKTISKIKVHRIQVKYKESN